ncbi:hypothetical protein PIB30_115101 [Stylosanthes scabra]|uniref:Uncharacterized protein n=1 Tax=Stylosanthes scabra TaxID=79078 RepID=A0ABU6R407_9FABA|nr:hypothetical protein [Stylosanthes scabra]
MLAAFMEKGKGLGFLCFKPKMTDTNKRRTHSWLVFTTSKRHRDGGFGVTAGNNSKRRRASSYFSATSTAKEDNDGRLRRFVASYGKSGARAICG